MVARGQTGLPRVLDRALMAFAYLVTVGASDGPSKALGPAGE